MSDFVLLRDAGDNPVIINKRNTISAGYIDDGSVEILLADNIVVMLKDKTLEQVLEILNNG